MTAMHTAAIREPVSRRLPGAGGRRNDRDRPESHRAHPRAPRRALSAQRAQPGRGGRPGHLPLVLRRRHGARAGAARRKGPLVPQPVGAHPGRVRRLGRAGARRTQSARRNAVGGPEHQRAESRRTHAGAGRGRRRQLPCSPTTWTPSAACDFDGTLAGGYTAHPHRDPRTGELHAVSYSFARGRTVQYSVIDTQGRARRTVDIDVTGSPMMHDFSLTDKYVVIYDLPVTFDPIAAGADERAALAECAGPAGDAVGARTGPDPQSDQRADEPQHPAVPSDALQVESRIIRRASESCPAKAAIKTCAGSTSSPATSSTRSMPTRKCGTAKKCWCST